MNRIFLKFIILLFVFGSCSNKKESESKIAFQTEKQEKKIVKRQEKLTTEIIKKYLIKKWISDGIEFNDKILTFYSFKEPKLELSDKFIIEFKVNGKLSFENTTKIYDCANGIPYFDKAKWEFKKGLYKPETNDYHLTNNLILHFRGGKLAESRFEFKREYRIKLISENKIELEQVDSLLEKFIIDGNNFYEE